MSGRIKALSLYKSILRAHDKFLPREMRQLGDAYVKSEFRLHKSAKPEQTTLFFTEWEKYLQHIERTGRENQSMEVGLVDRQQAPGVTSSTDNILQNRGPSFGTDVSNDIEFNEEQQGQLEKLREEAANAGGKI